MGSSSLTACGEGYKFEFHTVPTRALCLGLLLSSPLALLPFNNGLSADLSGESFVTSEINFPKSSQGDSFVNSQ